MQVKGAIPKTLRLGEPAPIFDLLFEDRYGNAVAVGDDIAGAVVISAEWIDQDGSSYSARDLSVSYQVGPPLFQFSSSCSSVNEGLACKVL